jgi:arsenate reductase
MQSASDAAHPKVLFVCVHNAGRSRMAEAFYNHLAARATAQSAGTDPAEHPYPEVVKAMREIGVRIDEGPGRMLTPAMLGSADVVVTMGCNVEEACPGVLVDAEDWNLSDPKGQPIEEVRNIRDEIKARVEALIADSPG